MNENHTLTNDEYTKDKFNQNSVVHSLIKTNIDVSGFQIGSINTDRSTDSHDKIEVNSKKLEYEDEFIKKTLCSRQIQIIFFIMAFCLFFLLLLLYLN